MMQNMPQGCMPMMMQMMHGRGMQAHTADQSPATKAYMEAAERMHGPMMEGIQASDPDIAFVRGMIAHHQGAIDMAKVVLHYGKNDQAKKMGHRGYFRAAARNYRNAGLAQEARALNASRRVGLDRAPFNS
jgi:uncharacterized protein (DUF305 family)